MSLSNDLITEVLGRVDGITLANAGCVCSDFWSIAEQEIMWEKACCSMWPSTGEKDVKELISSSLGGFRKFYADCFRLIAYENSRDSDSHSNDLKKLNDDSMELHTEVPSDFVSLVDVHYKNRVVYSEVLRGIPGADDFQGWFSNCPFRIDLINFSDGEEEDHNIPDGLPTVFSSVDMHTMDGKFWGHLMDNIRLSWIVLNNRTKQVANLSSWKPLVGQRHWPCDKDFVIRFGSILPDIVPCKFVQCIILVKCRLSNNDHTSLNITEISIQLEDTMGAHVNGRKSLLILEKALGCRRSKHHNQVLESYHRYLTEQNEMRQTKRRNEGRLDTLCILSGILAFASLSYFIFRQNSCLL